ncbi:hypothetical protein [Roseicella frigidaeris]|uniref:hypothetical protein n=1 Tax=Roseicella frigidaeris TaxID=2230885 RepID=UPI001A9E0BE8|nr:hypothetical protein [Roseicella frigidaeris]
MPSETSEAAFEALVARAGIPLTAEQRAALRAVWPRFGGMLRLLRDPAPGMLAEPAATFSAEPGR